MPNPQTEEEKRLHARWKSHPNQLNMQDVDTKVEKLTTEKATIVWGDEYEGTRYVYHSPLRPIVASWVPKGITIVATPGQDKRTLVTTNPLPAHFVEQWSLEIQPEAKTAYNYGYEAFARGLRAPAQDKAFLEATIKPGTEMGSSIPALDEWSRGWTKAQLDSTKHVNIPGLPSQQPLQPHGLNVPPRSLEKALAHLRTGGRLAIPTYTRSIIIDAKAIKRWEKTGQPLLREEGDGYRMRTGRSSVYILPGQLKYID